jgi:hypothetical protein
MIEAKLFGVHLHDDFADKVSSAAFYLLASRGALSVFFISSQQ